MTPRKTLIIGLAVALTGIAAITAYRLSRPGGSSGDSPAKAAETSTTTAAGIPWHTDLEEALKQAGTEEKLVVIDFFATWCGPCKLMDQNTFTDADVQKRVSDFVALKIDVDLQPEVARRYGIEGLPTTMVVDAEGKPAAQAVGYLDPARFLKLLDSAGQPKKSPSEPDIPGESAPSLGVKTWFNLPDGQTTVEVSDYKSKVVYL